MTRRKEAGQAVVFAAVGMTIFLGFAGLAIDMGVLRYDKRLQQSAADAAALAGASDLGHGGVTSGAQGASAANGFTDNGGGQVKNCGPNAAIGTVCVQINNPPADATVNGITISAGPHTGNGNYVEALVSVVQPTYFMRALGITKQSVTARAVATNLSGAGPNAGCLYTLGPPSSAIEGVNLNGNATLNAPTCGIEDNGNYNTQGNSLFVSAGSFGVSGSKNVSGPGGSVTCAVPGPCPQYDVPAGADPLASKQNPITPPPQPAPSQSCTPTSGKDPCNVTTSGTQTLQPGEFTSITIGKNSTVTLNPGIYYIDGSGGISFNGSATLTGSGVMFYFTNGASINAVGGGNQLSNIQLSAPTTGNYAGILMYEDPLDTNTGPGPNKGPTLGGNDKSVFQGVLYFPKDQLMFFGNAKGNDCSAGQGFQVGIVVADAIAMSGTPTVCMQGATGFPPGTNPIQNAILVE
jgi:hypothetical protein